MATVLDEAQGHVGRGQRLGGRGHAFLQRHRGVVQGVVAPELDDLGVVLGKALRLTELFQHQERDAALEEFLLRVGGGTG